MVRLFWNLALIAACIFALYYFKVWPFKQNVAGIEYLTDKYCGKKDAPRETAICDCIVRSAEMDMKTRFNEKNMLKSRRTEPVRPTPCKKVYTPSARILTAACMNRDRKQPGISL